eukprot:GEMP01008579.1.p1 GENE.GEMP01008579.1~~GEMP01008579.1.p1  ORF type:complete len:408 (+),score=109.81 GEMP01008579.1:94-1317(+)
MAPKRKQSPAQKKSASAAKKQKVDKKVERREQHEIDSDAVQSVLREYCLEDEHIKEMLVNGCAYGFNQYKSERHDFYGQVINMVGQTLQGLIKGTEDKKAETQHIIDNADNIKEGYTSKLGQIEKILEENETLLESKEQLKSQQEDTNNTAETDLDEKKDNLEECASTLEEMESDFADAESKKASYEKVRDEPSSNPKALKKEIQGPVPLFKKMEMEESLLVALPSVLNKKPEDRGAFDKSVITAANELIGNYLRKIHAEIGGKRTEKQEMTTIVENAKTVFDQTTAALSKSNDEIENIECEIEGLKSQIKSLHKSGKEHAKNMSKNKDLHEEHEAHLSLLQDTFSKFYSLRDREVIADEAVEPVEPPAAENPKQSHEKGSVQIPIYDSDSCQAPSASPTESPSLSD